MKEWHWRRTQRIPRAWTRSLRRTFHQQNSWAHEFEKVFKNDWIMNTNKGPPQAPPGFANSKDWIEKYRGPPQAPLGFANWKDWIEKYWGPPQAPLHLSGEIWMNGEFSKTWTLWWNSFKTPCFYVTRFNPWNTTKIPILEEDEAFFNNAKSR